MKLSVPDIAGMIDHSLLRPNLTEAEFMEGVDLSRKYRIATCSVVPFDVARTVKLLAGSGVPVSTVVAFPHGTVPTAVKVFEARQSIESGAIELDMVMAISRMMAGDYTYVEDDIHAVAELAHANGATLKVIFENCFLTKPMIVKGCQLCEAAGADFVKTSTGFSKGGATAGDVALMRYVVGSTIGVKASGGIRTTEDAKLMIASGADRIGASASVKIVKGEAVPAGGY